MAVGFDDTRWRSVNLPHVWSVEGPYSPHLASATGYLPGGIAWYRKAFTLDENAVTKRVYIYFEGIYRDGEVFINGTSLGMRPSGYISYLYDLTPYIRHGEINAMAVRVDHSKSADSRWYTGSGIYRNVYLIYANPVHIGQWGVYWTTPEVNAKQATVNMGDYKGNKLRVFQGKMIAYVEATGEPGIATVNFLSTWLKGAEGKIEVIHSTIQ